MQCSCFLVLNGLDLRSTIGDEVLKNDDGGIFDFRQTGNGACSGVTLSYCPRLVTGTRH